MPTFDLIATAKLGLESLVADEIRKLGYAQVQIKNGEVEFKGDERAIARCNLWLRTAERVFLKVSEFPAVTFDELYEETLKIDWPKLIPENGFMHVDAKCVLSKILSRQSSQSIVKKAVVESMKRAYKTEWFEESGPEYNIHIEFYKDVARLLLDTSGAGLHKRSYRALAGEAPLRETMAAAMVILSKWKPGTPLFDPCCGSGTIAIEAALIGANIAPGLMRNFDSEKWPLVPAEIWDEERKAAEAKICVDPFTIEASDIDHSILVVAQDNAQKAGVERWIRFTEQDIKDFRPEAESGIVLCNPPYGERLLDLQASEKIIRAMGQALVKKSKWTYHILSPHNQFEKIFGRKAFRNRKVYNGKIRCYLYSFS
ncbi:class I SAM-dependent RNA methyltransferase [Candidatus Peregrinibacteria bacterium]|nr:class I SAM-dependent RNA methyltransferase [Candidatus Peregrinibacteria bacterium]